MRKLSTRKRDVGMTLNLPYPPSINHYYIRARQGRIYIGKAGLEYRGAVGFALDLLDEKTLTGLISLNIVLHPPDKRKRDIDNVLKALLDALQHGGAFVDDSQIWMLTIVKAEPSKGGSVTVTITEDKAAYERLKGGE